ncbi:MAG: winged helix-turn-helix transcriptional regulator [Planctomycetes bacterium]|nr:winged helix-turn-helix transcriptional regulator [Planctomycetota bacterium]
MEDQLQSSVCARYLKALSDPDRLKIIQCLQDGPKNVSEIAGLLGRELVNVSHHLGVLRHAGIVQDRKQGKYVLYSLHPSVLAKKKRSDHGKEILDLGCCRLEWDG